ncbi:methyltransferase-like protein 25B [Condylostylus longicornis]|uniref:methyltransferase-like protein 25B n=1 Tax=Condylostylus longicornis TaxID=2530218 RepID=UPI00244E4573|nr:methyltransferase-like protein 25B [Condylostylus longicornis]
MIIKEDYIKSILTSSLEIVRKYEWLINSYVLDFFVDRHWEKLPNSWKSIEKVEPEKLCELLEENVKFTVVWPLSILSLKVIFQKLALNRKPPKESLQKERQEIFSQKNIKNKFEKNVKLKKRHEIIYMSEITKYTANKTGAEFVVDFGAGLGHFARILYYRFNLRVCCIEMQSTLNENARILDKNFEEFLHNNSDLKKVDTPKHITMTLTNSVTPEIFKEEILNAFRITETESFKFGIVGLHPCGDLAAVLINMFLKCKAAKFLNLIGCCYMKLTQSRSSENVGYPLSSFLKYEIANLSTLSYESREIACHAIEMYVDRLRSGSYNELKVHTYRAIIEQIITRIYPNKKHIALRNVKHTTDLDFLTYCEIATKNTGIDINKYIDIDEVNENLSQWKNVVIFYTLRLLFAPLLESIILYDRVLHLIENGCEVNIEPIFNPRISPRNHITFATKIN